MKLNPQDHLAHYTKDAEVWHHMKQHGFVVMDGIDELIQSFEQADGGSNHREHYIQEAVRVIEARYGKAHTNQDGSTAPLYVAEVRDRDVALDLHTDNPSDDDAHELFMLYFDQHALRGGGSSLLGKGENVYKQLSGDMIERLTQPNAVSTRSREIPFFDTYKNTNRMRVRFMGMEHCTLNTLDDEMERDLNAALRASADEIMVPEGKLLLFDNIGMLHGRTTALGNSKVYRAYTHYDQSKVIGDFQPGFTIQ